MLLPEAMGSRYPPTYIPTPLPHTHQSTYSSESQTEVLVGLADLGVEGIFSQSGHLAPMGYLSPVPFGIPDPGEKVHDFSAKGATR